MVNFKNGETPINDTNLNKMQTDLEELIKPVILYDNKEGTTNNIVLNKAIEDFKYFEIESYVNYSGVKVFTTTGKIPIETKDRIHLNNFFVGVSSSLQGYCKRISISEKNLTITSDRSYNSAGPGTDGTFTYITRIIGYKEV